MKNHFKRQRRSGHNWKERHKKRNRKARVCLVNQYRQPLSTGTIQVTLGTVSRKYGEGKGWEDVS